MPSSPSTQKTGNDKIPPKSPVQTGIDRYFDILKRKRSPASKKNTPAPKQTKTQVETSSNRFAILDNEENGDTTDLPTKEYKPPPIYVREQCNNLLINSLSTLIGSNTFHVVSMRRGNIQETKVQVYTEKNYRIVIDDFDKNNKNYYTYKLKSAKGLIVVIKGIESSVSINEVKEAIISGGYEVKSVQNIKNRNKIPQPLFRVEIAFDRHMYNKNEPHPIYSLRYLLHHRITVEAPHKRKDPVQCQNCQEYGHTKTYCKLPTVCVICGCLHSTKECTSPKNDPDVKKCSNCGNNHTANYRGCPIFIQMRQRPSQRANIDSNRRNNFNATASNNNYTPQNFTNMQSYSQVVQNPVPQQQQNPGPQQQQHSSLEASLNNLVQSMYTFMDRMTGMLQEMMRNQSILIETLSKK